MENQTSNTSKTIITKKYDNKEFVDKFSYGMPLSIMFTMGATIGAGIYFKTGQLFNGVASMIGGGSWVLGIVILTLVISMFGFLSFSLTLGVLNKRNKYRHLGAMGWILSINSNKSYNAFKSFMLWIYIPISMIFMSYYVVQGMQDGVTSWIRQTGDQNNHNLPPQYLILCIVGVIIYSTIISFHQKVLNVQDIIVWFLKLLPIFIIVIGGIAVFATTDSPEGWNDYKFYDYELAVSPFTKITHLGMFGCFPAMFFIFDGFYTPTHTFNQMRRPSRGPASVCIGVVIITLIYILILVGMYLGSDGANNVSMVQFPEWLKGSIMIFITFGVLGLTSGTAMLGANMYRRTFPKIFKLNLAEKKSHVVIFTLGIQLIAFGFMTLGGIFYRSPAFYDNFYDPHAYPQIFKNLLEFMDLSSNIVTSVLFMFFTIPLYGILRDRNEKQTRGFKIAAITAICFLSIPTIYMTAETIFNLIYFCSISQEYAISHRIIVSGGKWSSIHDYRVGQIVRVCFFSIIGLIILTGYHKNKIKQFLHLQTANNITDNNVEVESIDRIEVAQNDKEIVYSEGSAPENSDKK